MNNFLEKIKLLLVNLHSSNSTVSNHEFKILESNKISNLTIVNNSGSISHTFTFNKEFIFILKDPAGNL